MSTPAELQMIVRQVANTINKLDAAQLVIDEINEQGRDITSLGHDDLMTIARSAVGPRQSPFVAVEFIESMKFVDIRDVNSSMGMVFADTCVYVVETATRTLGDDCFNIEGYELAVQYNPRITVTGNVGCDEFNVVGDNLNGYVSQTKANSHALIKYLDESEQRHYN